MVCTFADRSVLKSARLACKELNNAAQISLFRQIYLRRIINSLCRLHIIASTPHLATLVKSIAYSGKILNWYNGNPDCDRYSLDRWRDQHLDTGLRTPHSWTSDLPSEYKQLDSQRLMQRCDIEEDDLNDAFKKLPRLEEISTMDIETT